MPPPKPNTTTTTNSTAVVANNNTTNTNATVSSQAAQNANDLVSGATYYFPPINVVHTWNTKRLLPPPLLNQYVPFCVVFLVDDLNGSFFTATQTNQNNSIIYGSPTNTVAGIEQDFAQGVFQNYNTNSPNSKALYSQYFSDSISNGVFRLGNFNGIKAKIIGYNNNQIVTLIPISMKMSQLTTPEMKGIFEVKNFEYEINNINGYGTATLGLESNDITQMFSFHSVQAKVFQNYNRYFVIYGWQGPTLQEFQVSAQQNGISTEIVGSNSISVILPDDSSYVLNLPSPFIKPTDGTINTEFDQTNDCYVFDIDDTDNGNRQNIVFYGNNPDFSFQYPKVTINLKMFNAGQGWQISQYLALWGGNPNFSGARTQLVNLLNSSIKPIGFFNLNNIFGNQGIVFDAESEQAEAETFLNNIKAQLSTGSLLNFSDLQVDNNNSNSTNNTTNSNSPLPSNNNNTSTQPPPPTTAFVAPPTTAGNPNFSATIQTNSVNIANLSSEAQYNLQTLLGILRDDIGVSTVILTSGKRNPQTTSSGATILSDHSSGNAVDFKTPNNDMPTIAGELKQLGYTQVLYEVKGQVTSNGAQSTGDHIHVSLRNSQVPTTPNTQNLSTITAPSFATNFSGDTGTEFPIQNPAGSMSGPAISPITSAVPTQSINSSQLQGFTQVPAAYRLGDIITVGLEIIDTILNNRLDFNGIKDILSKAGVKTIKLSGKTYSINKPKNTSGDPELTKSDVFQPTSSNSNNNSATNNLQNFYQSIQDALKNSSVNLSPDDNYSISSILHASPTLTQMSETIGYYVIANDANNNVDINKFTSLLKQFSAMSTGLKLSELKSKIPSRYSRIDPNIQATLFTWDQSYSPDSFNIKGTTISGGPITVADLPISVDTLSRILNGMMYNKTPEDFINTIINAVSLDYGFSLRMFHRTPGSTPPNDPNFMNTIKTDFENSRRTATNIQPIDGTDFLSKNNNIKIILDDQFLSEKIVADAVRIYGQNNGKMPQAQKPGVNNQWSAFQSNLASGEYPIPQNTDQLIANQNNAIQAEFSTQKLNSLFIVDYASLNTLVKSLSMSKIDGNTLANQEAIINLYKTFGGINGDFALTNDESNNPDKQGIVNNISSLNTKLSEKIINDYHLLPGRQEFELKYIQLISEVYDQLLNNNSNSNNPDTASLNPDIQNINTTLKKSFATDEDRRKFLSGVISNYLYNRPMGIKYQFYFGQVAITIHGTTGLGFTQGIYVRGIISQLDGTYLISSLKHVLDDKTFNTQINAVLISSSTQLATNKIFSQISNPSTTPQQVISTLQRPPIGFTAPINQ